MLHQLGRFGECVTSWEDSEKCRESISVLDLMPVSEMGTKITVAHSLSCTGRQQEAYDMITAVHEVYPVPAVAELRKAIGERLAGLDRVRPGKGSWQRRLDGPGSRTVGDLL